MIRDFDTLHYFAQYFPDYAERANAKAQELNAQQEEAPEATSAFGGFYHNSHRAHNQSSASQNCC